MHSPYPDLDFAIRRLGGRVPLSWVRSLQGSAANFGDTASAIVVAALGGLAPMSQAFDDPTVRLVAVGTIGQAIRFGTAHFWGTGVDPRRRAFGRLDASFAAAPDTAYVIHATRGPHSRRTLLDAGLHAPPIYGDGAWFLPRILPGTVEKRHELGVIPHLSELEGLQPTAISRHPRHAGGAADGVRVISTLHAPDLAAFQAKFDEIRACRRIASSSFHGLMIAEACGIPCLYFPYGLPGARMESIVGAPPHIDNRLSDFYGGAGRSSIATYAQPAAATTPWDAVIAAVDRLWTPLEHPGAATFLEAFPLTRRFGLGDAHWPLDAGLMQGVPL